MRCGEAHSPDALRSLNCNLMQKVSGKAIYVAPETQAERQ